MVEREMFERYAHQMGKRDFEQNEFGDYQNPFTQEPWNFWRASREALQTAGCTEERSIKVGELEMLTDDERALNEHLKSILHTSKKDDRQKFEEEWSKMYGGKGDFLLRHHTLSDQYANLDTQYAWEGWQAARRITHDREEIIEECAKVCEGDGEETPDAWDWHSKDYAKAIRALKTAPTSDKGGA